eukprot:CAMPEP_0197410220 /NCGR_PEP_ID=MMETSP1165-20131217/31053_1 /TAXON_ID=284809 /ORGANISM="Chrysocystis fragilis, Strain CCMP3189" /LENGTH=337 /DNA_ID=CAMNT_0042936715 /DNA_START=258 /DNA_END=1268 /DNA_ORIENTATION=+
MEIHAEAEATVEVRGARSWAEVGVEREGGLALGEANGGDGVEDATGVVEAGVLVVAALEAAAPAGLGEAEGDGGGQGGIGDQAASAAASRRVLGEMSRLGRVQGGSASKGWALKKAAQGLSRHELEEWDVRVVGLTVVVEEVGGGGDPVAVPAAAEGEGAEVAAEDGPAAVGALEDGGGIEAARVEDLVGRHEPPRAARLVPDEADPRGRRRPEVRLPPGVDEENELALAAVPAPAPVGRGDDASLIESSRRVAEPIARDHREPPHADPVQRVVVAAEPPPRPAVRGHSERLRGVSFLRDEPERPLPQLPESLTHRHALPDDPGPAARQDRHGEVRV